MSRVTIFCLALVWLALVGCRPEEPIRPVDRPAASQAEPQLAVAGPTAVLPPTSVPATATSPAPTEMPSPTPPASPTPRPVIRLKVPDQWRLAAESAIAELEGQGTTWYWQLVPAGESANMTLEPGEKGVLAGYTSLALAVPWATDWTNVSLADAQAILAGGHDLVTVVDWAEIGPEQKPLQVDGLRPGMVGYPFQQPWSLVALPGFEAATAELAAKLITRKPGETLVHLAAVGDIMLDRALGYAISQGNLDYPFSQVAPLLQAADFTVGNLESSLADTGQAEVKSYTFRAPPAAAESLARAGFDLVSLANNHAMDFGPEALEQGLDLLAQQGVATIGAGSNAAAARAPHITTIQGLNLAFLGYVHVPVEVRGFDTALWTATDTTPGLAWAVPAQITTDVQAARQQADLVVVILHSGFEYVIEPSSPQVAAAKAAIDAGAALVIGHHAHILQGVEFYNGGVIVYGLGNFAFEIDGDPGTAILNVWLDRDGVRQLEIVPAVIQFGGQPRLAESWEAPAILQPVFHQTNMLKLYPPSP